LIRTSRPFASGHPSSGLGVCATRNGQPCRPHKGWR
jgi:hypothetical protein